MLFFIPFKITRDKKLLEDLRASWIQVVELMSFGSDEDGDSDGDEDDDVEADRKRGRKESSLALRNVEKGDAGSKPKKRAKVLIEMSA